MTHAGYAVSSGNFRSTDSVQGVASAPRATRFQKDITTGKVIIYNLTSYEVYQELYGELVSIVCRLVCFFFFFFFFLGKQLYLQVETTK